MLRMPSFLPPAAVQFELRDGRPVLRLAAEESAAGTPDGWSLMNRLTMCVVDGPGDAGYLLARLGPDGLDTAPRGWDDAVERAGGCTVEFATNSLFVPSAGR
jgi:hypothetical protein